MSGGGRRAGERRLADWLREQCERTGERTVEVEEAELARTTALPVPDLVEALLWLRWCWVLPDGSAVRAPHSAAPEGYRPVVWCGVLSAGGPYLLESDGPIPPRFPPDDLREVPPDDLRDREPALPAPGAVPAPVAAAGEPVGNGDRVWASWPPPGAP